MGLEPLPGEPWLHSQPAELPATKLCTQPAAPHVARPATVVVTDRQRFFAPAATHHPSHTDTSCTGCAPPCPPCARKASPPRRQTLRHPDREYPARPTAPRGPGLPCRAASGAAGHYCRSKTKTPELRRDARPRRRLIRSWRREKSSSRNFQRSPAAICLTDSCA